MKNSLVLDWSLGQFLELRTNAYSIKNKIKELASLTTVGFPLQPPRYSLIDSFAASAVRLNLALSLGFSFSDSRRVLTTSLTDFKYAFGSTFPDFVFSSGSRNDLIAPTTPSSLSSWPFGSSPAQASDGVKP